MEQAAEVFDDPTLRTDEGMYAEAALAPMTDHAKRALQTKCDTFFVDYDMCPPNPRTMHRRWNRANDPPSVAALGLLTRTKRPLDVVDTSRHCLWNVPVPQLCEAGSAGPLLAAHAQSQALHDLPQLWQQHEQSNQ